VSASNVSVLILFSQSLNGSDNGVYHTELLGFGPCPSSGFLKTKEHKVRETGSVFVLRLGGTPTLSGTVVEVSSF
jgi:hypothetical protein